MTSRSRRIPGVGSTGQSLSQILHRSRNRARSKIVSGVSQVVLECDIENIISNKLLSSSTANPFRYGDYIHVSDLLGKCPRMIAISYSTGTEIISEDISDSMGLTFSMGEGIHNYIREKISRTHPAEVYGQWECNCGNMSVTDVRSNIPEYKQCNTCNGYMDNYRELHLKNEETGISGSVDLTLKFDSALYFTEIKSIKHETWKELVRPVPQHLLQALFYWWLAREANIPVHKQVSILYATKGFVFGNPYKEFTINPEDHIHRLDDYIEDAKMIKSARSGGTLPYRVCPDASSPQAKKCSMCAICFSIK